MTGHPQSQPMTADDFDGLGWREYMRGIENGNIDPTGERLRAVCRLSRAKVDELTASLRNTEGQLGKVANWLGRLARAAEHRASDKRFLSLAEANAADAKNYRATIASIMPALEAARKALAVNSQHSDGEAGR